MPGTVRGKIIANSALIILLMAGASLYSGFASLELDRSVEVLFRNNLGLETLQMNLDQTEASFSEYLRTKSSDSLKEYIKYSTRLSDQSRNLNREIFADELLLLQRDLSRSLETYLQTAEEGIAAKRGRDISGYAESFETSTLHSGGARLLIATLKARFLSRSLQAFSLYRNLIPGVLWSNAGLVLAATFLGFVLLLRYSRNLTEPLARLAQAALAVGQGKYETEIPLLDSHDEITTLARTFNQMQQSVRLSFLEIQDRAEVERNLYKERMRVLELNHRLKDAELLALQTQINPHFLFNTLSAGIELAGSEEANRTEDFLQNLAAFIRYALTPPDRLVQVADEVDCAKRYIWLLRLRFRQRFTFDMRVDERILGAEIPALILQPLIENAVGHGLADREEGGLVTIRGSWEGNRVLLSVKDNGAGMSQADRVALLAETAGQESLKSHGIGLRNVIRRIVLSTDGRGQVELDGELGQGLEVRVFLPPSLTQEAP